MATVKLVVRLAILLAACICTSSIRINENSQAKALAAEGRSSVVAQHGRLRRKGNQIVGKAGSPVRLRGMSLFWSQWMSKYWNADVVKWLQKDWQCTLVRAAMGVEEGGYLENPSREKAHVAKVVDAAIAAGIYVIIDWHDHHGEQHLNAAKAFFDEMARKYGKVPNVLFEVYNEPMQQSWSGTIKPYHEAIVPVIRKHSDNLIILGTRTWSQEVDEASSNPVKGTNLAYTIHFYASTHKQDLRNKVSKALANGVPLFATEWGTCDASGNGALDLAETQTWLNFLKKHHISDANWAIGDKDESCSALRPGSSSKGGWSVSQLTESGRFVRASMRADGSSGGDTTRRRRSSTTRRRRTATIRRRRTTTTRRRRTTMTRRRRTPTAGSCSKVYKQCGGKDWNGPKCCQQGLKCSRQDQYYSQCLPK